MSAPWLRPFGAAGIPVSAVGFGAGHIGGPELTDAEAGRLLNRVLDLGVNLIDTARSYGLSEERIGRHLAARRSECVLSTKIGYGVAGVADWTAEVIPAGVREALRLLRTDYLDIVHLHTCPRETLERGEVLAALADEVAAGRVRVAAYSGDNEPLAYAAASGRVGGIQCSTNLVDQWALRHVLPDAARRGLGVIAKRPIANAPWRFAGRPVGHYCETYWERWRRLNVDPRGLDWTELALRFAAYAPGVHACIVGTRDAEHLARNVEVARKGPLPPELLAAIAAAYEREGAAWIAQV